MKIIASNQDGSVIAHVAVPETVRCETLLNGHDGAKILQIINNPLICGDFLVIFPASAGLSPGGRHKEQFCGSFETAVALYRFVGGK